MNLSLWNKVVDFDFDNPPSEYGFSIRLANENYWTKSFTQQAILEYKKFMYLAATSDFMVSPSEIVDTVWHQHLIFTQSYQDFCNILGKQIQHIPSTHNKEDFEKFKNAKERTTKFYERDFGQQPNNIWEYNDMFESLNLEKAKFKIRTFVIVGILASICLAVPAYFLLKPIYVHIGNPNFIISLIILIGSTFLLLEFYNRKILNKIVSRFDKNSFVYNLQPYEVVFSKTQKFANVINGAVNELIEKGIIKVHTDNSIELANTTNTTLNKEQLQITAALRELGLTYYPNLLRKVSMKPAFGNVVNCIHAFRKYFNKSKKFGMLFYTNFGVLIILLLVSFTRIVTGVLRDKPVFQIVIVAIILTIIIVAFLQRLTKQILTTTITNLYKDEILPARQLEHSLDWSYFLFGTAALTASFVPLANYIDKNNNTGNCGSSCGSICGSSCGSSCSSCGGCGGD